MKNFFGLSTLACIAEAVYYEQQYDPRPIDLAQLLATVDLDDEADGEPTIDANAEYEAESLSSLYNQYIAQKEAESLSSLYNQYIAQKEAESLPSLYNQYIAEKEAESLYSLYKQYIAGV